MSPTFSIVIPAYNRPQELVRALRSCLQQSFTDFEIIVVDDGSEIDLERVVRHFNDLRLRFVRQTNQGGGAARNRGVSLATGDYIAFLDSDDIFLPDKLAKMSALLKCDPTPLYYSSVFLDRGIGTLWIKPRACIDQHENIFDYFFIRQGWVPMSSVVVNTAVARRVRFNEDLRRGQDMQFASDVWKLGLRLVMVSEPLIICDDRRSALRVSQRANIDATDVGPYQSYLDWIESVRPLMSLQTYNAWQAKFKARLVASHAPGEALRYLWTAYRSGVFSRGRVLRQSCQIFMPKLYWMVSNVVIRLRGMEPSNDVRRLLTDL